MKKSTFFLGIIVFLLTACHSSANKSEADKYAAVYQKHDARIKDIRTFLSELKKSLPEAGTENTSVGDLNPSIKLGSDDTCNTLILQYHLLNSPENFTSYDSLFNLNTSTIALEAFRWTGTSTKDHMIGSAYMSTDAVDQIFSSLSTERFPYLLIVKATNFEKVKQNNDDTFEGGGATASFYLYDFRNKKPLSSISLTASPSASMSYAYNTKDNAYAGVEAANEKVKESMQKNMQLKVYEWLKAITNNTAIVPSTSSLF